MKPKVSILIVNWNSRDYLRSCLNSIRAHCADLRPQMIVVDGGSFDGCAEMLMIDFPEVDFIQSNENIGFARSNNLGAHLAQSDALLLLNPDTEIKPGAVHTMLRELDRLPNVGMIGPCLLNTDGSLQKSGVHVLPTPFQQAFDSEFLRCRLPFLPWWVPSHVYTTRKPVQVEAVSGACILLRTSAYRALGGFSDHYFMYAEDMDLCLKIRRSGLTIYYVPASVIVHHGCGSSRLQFSKFATVEMRKALYTYMRSNHGLPVALLYRLLMLVSGLVRLLVLLPTRVLAQGESRMAACVSMAKWWSVLGWCLGLERSAIHYPNASRA